MNGVGRRSRRRLARRGTVCLNCDAKIETRFHFCPHCGQENISVNTSLWEIFREASEEFVRFDSKLVVTLWPLISHPGKLTQEWAAGRRTKYLSPLKLYFTITALFFLIMPILHPLATPLVKANMGSGDEFTLGVAEGLDGAKNKGSEKATDKATGKATNLATQKPTEAAKVAPPKVDPKATATSPVKAKPAAEATRKTATAKPFKFFGREVEVAEINNSVQRIRTIFQPGTDPRIRTAFSQQIMSHLPTALFAMLPVYAFVLWILYIRRKRYYVEHLVFALHCHAFYFVVLTMAAIAPAGAMAGSLSKWGPPVASIWIIAYSLLALKKNYGQGWWKTAFKWSLLGFAYIFLLSFVMVGSVIAAGIDMKDAVTPPPTVRPG